ncbi:MAG: hypothetical protein OT477_01715 [Chloroflexi bacterium]|nr:hypothetical protein [Chloroflexota bacterium]
MSGSPVVPYSVAIVLSAFLGVLGGGVLVWWLLRNLWREPLERVGRQLETKLGRVQQENVGLRGRLRRAAQSYTHELHQHQQTIRDKAAVQLELARLEGRARELNMRLEEAHGHLATTQRALEESQDKISELEISAAGAKQRHEHQSQMIGQLQVEQKVLQAETAVVRQALAEAQKEIGRIQALTAEKATLQMQLDAMRQQLHQRESQQEGLVTQLVSFGQQTGALQAQLTAAQANLADREQLKQTLESAQAQIMELEKAVVQHKRANLEDIDGIGRVFATRLQEAGIDTFEKLVNTPAADLRRIVQLKEWQAADIASWQEQARGKL